VRVLELELELEMRVSWATGVSSQTCDVNDLAADSVCSCGG
jgi:hypothetical protein